MQRLHKYEKNDLLILLVIPVLPLEWKQQKLLRYLVHQKIITSLFMSFYGDGNSMTYPAVKDLYIYIYIYIYI